MRQSKIVRIRTHTSGSCIKPPGKRRKPPYCARIQMKNGRGALARRLSQEKPIVSFALPAQLRAVQRSGKRPCLPGEPAVVLPGGQHVQRAVQQPGRIGPGEGIAQVELQC